LLSCPPDSFALPLAVAFVVAFVVTVLLDRPVPPPRTSAPPPARTSVPPARPHRAARPVVVAVPCTVWGALDPATRAALTTVPGVTWREGTHVTCTRVVRGTDRHEHLVTALQAARVRDWRELPAGGVA
jgi:hypothetical protein